MIDNGPIICESLTDLVILARKSHFSLSLSINDKPWNHGIQCEYSVCATHTPLMRHTVSKTREFGLNRINLKRFEISSSCLLQVSNLLFASPMRSLPAARFPRAGAHP